MNNGYKLTRAWFDYSFEHQGELTSSHTAMYLWFVELNNRMGWAEKFGAPASQTMAAIHIKSYNTYKKVFDDLVEIGFVILVEASINQWTSCVIALSNFDKAHNKALDKSLTKHTTKQSESTSESTYSINKQETNKPKTNKPKTEKKFSPPSKIEVENYFKEKINESEWSETKSIAESKTFFDFYESKNWMVGKNKMSNWKSAISGWINRSKNNFKNNSNGKSNPKHNPTAKSFGRL